MRIAVANPRLSGPWAAATAGLGIAMRTRIGLPAHLVAFDPAQAGLPALPTVPLMLVHAERSENPVVSLLADILFGVIRERLQTI